jgi:hypothetical protein
VEPTSGIVIRRPKREDFEDETPYFGPGPSSERPFLGAMSAVATIRCKGTSPRDTQRAVEKLIAMLRLFEVASISYSSYQLFGDSLINIVAGQLRHGAHTVVHERGYIRSNDEARLLKFWHTFDPIIPNTFYEFSPTARDYRDMAYERYCAALMNPGSFEERVATAVMALEALFLEERQELGYRLRIRAAKVLGSLREQSVAVRDALGDAYDVRSTFAHGARLSSRERRRLEQRYRGIDGFVPRILNFVRKANIAILLVRRSKEDLIDLIDDALIERSAEDQLRQLLLPVAELV